MCERFSLTVQLGLRVLESAQVDVAGPVFRAYEAVRADWVASEVYTNPGPIQFEGACADDVTMTLTTACGDYLRRVRIFRERVARLSSFVEAGVPDAALDTALAGINALVGALESK